MASDAVGNERVSRVVGYKLTKGDFSQTTSNLPQRIAILAEANNANQGSLSTTAKEVTSAKQAGDLYGYGSPIYIIMRILRPVSGSGVGGIPTVVYPQAEAVGATAKILSVTPSGVATKGGTHTLIMAGRTGLDGSFYDINIASGDDAADITAKMADAVNAILGSPMVAVDFGGYETRFTSKWNGATANDLTITINTNDNDLGITYSVDEEQSGTGTPSISDALSQFGNAWNTIVINSYGTNSNIMTALEDFNGIPDPENPTGRYSGIIFKPFLALTGSTINDPSAITDARSEDVTIVLCPTPASAGLPMEAAANYGVGFALQAQNNPHLDISSAALPDMPIPSDGNIGSMADYENRDAFVKKGCSTVDLISGTYRVQDFVTTYHLAGEIPPQFRYCRNLNIDFNIRYGVYLLEQIHVVNHVIANDGDIVSASNVIKPKIWKGILDAYADSLALRGLIVDAAFMQDSIAVNISPTNPDRLETFFRYKRSGTARIASTTAEAGFNFGTTNI